MKKTDELVDDLNKKNLEGIQRLNTLSTRISFEENDMLEKMCKVLNGKKDELRRLGKGKGFYFEEPEDIVLSQDKSGTAALNMSQSEDGMNNSQVLSLTDLI
jgi:hypothetical protein